MKVGVRELQAVATLGASAARTRCGAGAEHRLTQPEREALLADAVWTVKENARRQRAAFDRLDEALAETLVAVEPYNGSGHGVG